jgi:hypothetical protein
MLSPKLRNLLFGTSLSQEYICVAKEKLSNKLRAYLLRENDSIDITNEHILLGYSPVLIGISSSKSKPLSALLDDINETTIKFGVTSDNIIAQLTVKKIEKTEFGSVEFFLFEGINGSHEFLSATYQLINSIKYKLQAKRKPNIYLNENLYQQVKIAYSIPRTILLVTLGSGDLFNIFPTDINGRIDDDHFVISLRKTGKAHQQVKKQGNIVISEMRVESCSEVYSYGVNHMRDLRPSNEFNFSYELSESLKLPLPKNISKYYELEIVNEMLFGMFNLMYFRIINSIKIDNSNTLAHIHRDYAQWRINNNFQSEFLFR